MKKILLIDDDISLCEVLSEYLSLEGFECDSIHDAQAGNWLPGVSHYDAIILDVTLPSKSGFDVLRELRGNVLTMGIPIIMLSAKGDETSRIVGLELGADDYMAKPFNARELTARIGAVSRRFTSSSSSYSFGNLQLNINQRKLIIDKKEITLSSVECKLMEELLKHQGLPVSRDHLSQSCLGPDSNNSDRAVDMHISRIRKKLNIIEGEHEYLKSIRGKGYAIASKDINQ